MKASAGASTVWHRVVVLLVLVLLVAVSASLAAFAQDAPSGDPPGRVARLDYFDGTVSFSAADSDQWSPAVMNRPLTRGDRLWVTQGARAELHIGSTAVRLDGPTRLDFAALDDQLAQLTLMQGTLSLRVRTLFEGQRYEINTPNLALVPSQPGEYRLDVDPASNQTRITLQSGAGTVYGQGGESLGLGGRQQLAFTGTSLEQQATQEPQDGFDRWVAERDRLEDQSVSARYVSRETPGYQQLDAYGDWRTDPSYGPIWVPRVSVADWAPYRWGHWSWIEPWGWTWIDDAPWGFAPSHFGRWAHISARWCWVPGPIVVRPVFVPALVVFIHAHRFAHAHFPVRPGHHHLAWFPLAPGEVWRPAFFKASPAFIHNVNRSMGVHHAANSPDGFRHQHMPFAVTAAAATAFVQGQPVRGHAHRLDAAELARSQVVVPPLASPERRGFLGAARAPLTAANPPRMPQMPSAGTAAVPPAQAMIRPAPPAQLQQPAPAALPAPPARVQAERSLPAFTIRPDITPRPVDGALLPARPQLQAQPPRQREHQGPREPMARDQAQRAQAPQMQVPPPQMQVPPPQMQVPPPQMQVPPPQMQVPRPQMQVPRPQMQVPPAQMQVPPAQALAPVPRAQMHTPQMQVPPAPQMQMAAPQMQMPAPQIHMRPPQTQQPAASPEQRGRHEGRQLRHGGDGHGHRGRD